MSEILFVATADTSDVDRKLNESANKAEEYRDRMVSYGEDVEAQFKSTADAINAAIGKQKQVISDLQTKLDQMRGAYNKTAPGLERDEIGVNIQNTEMILARETEALRHLEEQLTAINERLAGSTGLVNDWAEGFRSGTDIAGDGIKGISGTLVDEINKQKYILDSIKDNIKEVQNAYNKLEPGAEKDAYSKVLDELNGAFTKQQEIVSAAEGALTEYFSTFSEAELEDRLKALKLVQERLWSEFRATKVTPKGLNENTQEINAIEGALEAIRTKAEPAADAVRAVGKAGAVGMKGLIAGAAGAVLGLAALRLIIAAVGGIIKSNRVITDKFKVAMGGLTGALREAGRAIINSDWANFGKNMKKAAEDGMDFARSQMYIKARIDESKITIANMELEQAQLNHTLKTGGLVGEERAALEKEIFENEKRMAQERTKLAKERVESALKNTKLQKQYTKEEIEELILLAPAFEKNRKALEDYGKAKEWLDKHGSRAETIDKFSWDEHNKVVSQASEEVVNLSEKYEVWRRDTGKAYNEVIPLIYDYKKALAAEWKLGDVSEDQGAEGSVKRLRKELSDLKTEYDAAATDLERGALQIKIDAKELELSKIELKGIDKETKAVAGSIRYAQDELTKLREQYENVGTAAERAAVKAKMAAKEQEIAALEAADKSMSERLSDLREGYEKAVANYVTASQHMDDAEAERWRNEASRLAGEILSLQAILDLRERIADKLLKEAKEAKDSKIATVRVAPELDTGLRALSQEVADKNAEKQRIAADKAAVEIAQEELEVRLQILDTVSYTVNELGRALSIDPSIMDQMNNMIDFTAGLLKGIATGNWMQAIVSAVKFVADMIPSRTDILNQRLEEMNRLLDEQQRLIELAARKGGEAQAREAEIETLRKNLALLQEELAHWEKKFENSENAWNMFQSMAYEKRKKKVGELTDAVREAEAALQDAEQELNDFISGGVTETGIADSIAAGFREGKTSVDDFATYMNDILVDAVMNAFQARILGEQITGLTNFISESIGDDGSLSEAEVAKIQEWYQAIAESSKEVWDQLTGALDLGGIGEPGALSGGIQRQITEETGSELAGLMRKISDDNRQNRDYNKLTVDRLTNIEAYSYESMESLKTAVLELKAINSNTKPVYAGDL